MAGELQAALEAAKEVRKRYPRAFLEDSSELAISYFQAVIKLADKGSLTKRQACMLIADTLNYSSVKGHYEMQSIAIEAGCVLIPNQHKLDSVDERWEYLKLWILEH